MTFLAQSVLHSVSFYAYENTDTNLKKRNWKSIRNTVPNYLDAIGKLPFQSSKILFPEMYLDIHAKHLTHLANLYSLFFSGPWGVFCFAFFRCFFKFIPSSHSFVILCLSSLCRYNFIGKCYHVTRLSLPSSSTTNWNLLC